MVPVKERTHTQPRTPRVRGAQVESEIMTGKEPTGVSNRPQKRALREARFAEGIREGCSLPKSSSLARPEESPKG